MRISAHVQGDMAHVQGDTNTIQLFILANIGRLTFHTSIAQGIKQWPRFKINRWPHYVVMTMYIITGGHVM